MSGGCASAFGLAWPGGVRRLVHPDAKIGFHAAYVEKGGQTSESGAGNALLGAYLNQLGLQQSAIIYLTSAAPSDMQWLPVNEAKSIGIDLEIMDIAPAPDPAPPDSRPQTVPQSKGIRVTDGCIVIDPLLPTVV